MKHLFTLVIAFMLFSFASKAQITGADTISTDPNLTATYKVSLPGGATMESVSASVSTWGGIVVESIDNINNTVTIKSKNGTTKEEYFSKWGKGRIHVSYRNGDCGSWMRKDVYKSFDMGNDNVWGHTIVAPSCISPGDTVTVAVTPITTMAFPHSPMERYKWTFPDSLISELLFCAVDSSSFSFIAGKIGVSETISVKLGLYNFDNPQNKLTYTIHSAPPVPIISGPSCFMYGEKTSYGISNYSDDAVYTWFINGVEVMKDVPGTTKLEIDNYSQFIKSDIEIFVEANSIQGSCFGSVVGTFNAIRGLNHNEAWIYEKSYKRYLSLGEAFTFLVGGAGIDKYVTWEYPAAWKLSPTSVIGRNDNYVPMSVSSLSGQVKAYATSTYCSDTLFYDVYVKPGAVDSIVGSTVVLPGEKHTYKISNTPSPAPMGYEWTLPDGLVLLKNYGDSIEVRIGSGNLSGLSVTPLGGHPVSSIREDDGAKTLLSIGYAPTPVGVITAGQSCYNYGMETSNVSFSVPSIPGHSFIWEVSSGFGEFHEETTYGNILTGSVFGMPGTYTVSVQSKSGPNVSSHVETLSVTINTDYSLVFNSEFSEYEMHKNEVWINKWNKTAVVAKLFKNGNEIINGVTVNNWGSLTTTGRNPRQIEGNPAYLLKVQYTTPKGCSVKLKIDGNTPPPVAVNSSTVVASDLGPDNNNILKSVVPIAPNELFSLYPNPLDRIVNVQLTDYKESISSNIKIYNMNGHLIYQNKMNSDILNINTGNWPAGSYMVVVNTGNEYGRKKIVKK